MNKAKNHYDIIIIGGGISGYGFAFNSAIKGQNTLVIEKSSRIGGSLWSEQLDSDFWFEMGAHTCYNSYASLIEIIEKLKLEDMMLPRVKVPYRVFNNEKLISFFKTLNLPSFIFSLPSAFFVNKEGLSIKEYYSRIVGKENYNKIVGSLISAVPSQNADDFPATMLFKKRGRNKKYLRSFSIKNGLQTIVNSIAAMPNITTMTETEALAVEQIDKQFVVKINDDQTIKANMLAVATPPKTASKLLEKTFPNLSSVLNKIKITKMDSLGVIVKKEKLQIESVAGIVPVNDIFHSAVSRDCIPDNKYRGFTFHFHDELTHETKIKRIKEVLRISDDDIVHIAKNHSELPSPTIDHNKIVNQIDSEISEKKLAIIGNYLNGLAIEDCLLRSKSEFNRIESV